jgi:hypothetical protein
VTVAALEETDGGTTDGGSDAGPEGGQK